MIHKSSRKLIQAQEASTLKERVRGCCDQAASERAARRARLDSTGAQDADCDDTGASAKTALP